MSNINDLDRVYLENRDKFNSINFELANLDNNNLDVTMTKEDFGNLINSTMSQLEVLDRVFNNSQDLSKDDPTKLNSNLDLKQIQTNSSILKNVILLDEKEIPQDEDKTDNTKVEALDKVKNLRGLFKIKLSKNSRTAFDIEGFKISEATEGVNYKPGSFIVSFFDTLEFFQKAGDADYHIEPQENVTTELNAASVLRKNFTHSSGSSTSGFGAVYYEVDRGVFFTKGDHELIKSENNNYAVDVHIQQGLVEGIKK